MSDNSSSTGSSGSSTNSWTLLSPEEAAVETIGPADDGGESLGDAPSLSEEAPEFKPSDISLETVLSEEGHQVCQETSPGSSEGPVPVPPDLDTESQPPVIHDIVTSSPGDNEHLGATPFLTGIDPSASALLADEPEESCSATPPVETAVSEEFCSAPPPEETAVSEERPPDRSGEVPVFTAEPELDIAAASLPDLPPHAADGSELPGRDTGRTGGAGDDAPAPETGGSEEEEEEEVEEEPSGSFDPGDASGFDDGLRRRTVPSDQAPRPRTSDEEEEEEEEEEVEFKLAERKEEKPWFSVNKCIVGAAILLFLGSLFLSGDFDVSELSKGDQSQDRLSGDPQDMKQLLDKLKQEKQQISELEARLQAQREELDSALKAAAVSGDETGRADLERENTQLKEELASLPELKRELESLRARATEVSRLADDDQRTPPAPQPGDDGGQTTRKMSGPAKRKDANKDGRLKDELQRQKLLLEESRKRLDGMRKDGGDRKRVRDSLEAIQKKLSDQVERWAQRKPRETRRTGKKEEKRERKHSKDKEDTKEERTSHKEAWRKHQDEWERKKGERRVDREERRKEKPRSGRRPHRHDQNDFWRDQEQKLRRSVRPQPGCVSVEDCAGKEALYPVELPEFEELLEGYLSKLEGSSPESKDALRRLTAEYFEDGVFVHDRVLFGDFAEDVADILEDMADVSEAAGQKGAGALEEEMEEFEREALWKFAAAA
ncbi:pre-B-cell leukemia transcription factor-interacting protein 1 [Brachionichthys hirsutus]|uniref:pre-B-cell leukemia transcription factor-interacting protein 1 n=1 Tax=Brachionichthys hirsutus TaxID=412623 RepID=UPI0036048244